MQEKERNSGDQNIKICQNCEKEFYIPLATQWTYKIMKTVSKSQSKIFYYCCYTCYRAAGGDGAKRRSKWG